MSLDALPGKEGKWTNYYLLCTYCVPGPPNDPVSLSLPSGYLAGWLSSHFTDEAIKVGEGVSQPARKQRGEWHSKTRPRACPTPEP